MQLDNTDKTALTLLKKISYPPALPVSAERKRILALLAKHQVLVVCGETGSGKTTQLPKMLLEFGLEAHGATHGQRPRLIGHTQPRRIAATSVAKRIAQELQSTLGDIVGYQVRFSERLSAGLHIKLMTDGILLAETQSDPLFENYAALIIDEAHERSLNIDFLLGYVRTLLPKRPDLKLIITSATIDAERFAAHFSRDGKPAPVLNISGRTYPVEMRYHPFEEGPEGGMELAIAQAVDALWRNPGQQGDILVFLSGERAIRDTAEYLRGHLDCKPQTRAVEVLPLFSRLSQSEQERIFAAHGQRRIVLATNVAETSLTVPGIRYVIDSGQARIKRYSYRNKVELLRVEPISQAAANQRAGRSGRLAPGVCIRLYSEEDFTARPAFTDPEVLRASLAAVILRMKALHLGAIESFPFIDSPSGRAIADGYQALGELGALDTAGALTAIGKALAQLPVDPRLGRMLIEARQRGALCEMLVLASALSLQDVRERPLALQEKADAAHARFADEKSEFSGLLTLWHWLETARGKGDQTLSRRKWEQHLRAHFLSVRRVREWRETHAQLCNTIKNLPGKAWHVNTHSASYEQLHISILSGLLGNIGYKRDGEQRSPRGNTSAKGNSGEYLGARGIKFFVHPGVYLKRKPGRWLVAAELVETTRLFGRGVAHIEPAWVEQLAPHLITRQVGDPHWEKNTAKVVAFAHGHLYGLPIYQQRKCDFAQTDLRLAREIFLREALVAGTLGEDVWAQNLPHNWPFWQHNQQLLREIEALEHKQRRQDILVDEALIYAFFDAHIPQDIASGIAFSAWCKQARQADAQVLFLQKDALMRHEAAGITSEAFPPIIRLGGVDCKVSYLHVPGDSKDGVTVDIPLFALNQVSEAQVQWLVPGMLADKIAALFKSLPQRARSRLQPLAQSTSAACAFLQAPARFGTGALTQALADWVHTQTGLVIQARDFKEETLPNHCLMRFRVLGDDGLQLGSGRNLPKLKSEFGQAARGAFAALANLAIARVSDKPVKDKNQATLQTPIRAPHNKTPATQQSASAKHAVHQSSAHTQNTNATQAPETLYTHWCFGALPQTMEIGQHSKGLMGFPALVDEGQGVRIAVFDDLKTAQVQHEKGLLRLIALQLKDALKYLEKNIPDLQRMALAYMPLGDAQALRSQIATLALRRAFLTESLPRDSEAFAQQLQAGRARLNLIAMDITKLSAQILNAYQNILRKIKESKLPPAVAQDMHAQLQCLMPQDFLLKAPWTQLQHFPRYFRAMEKRLEKCKTNPARDAKAMTEVQQQEARHARALAAQKGHTDARLDKLRWLLQELRVSLFAQELKTPQPVSSKRLEKIWQQLGY